MPPTMKCKHGVEAPLADIEELPDYQGQEARHKCAVCAYKAGYNTGVDAGFKEGVERGTHAVISLTKALRSDDIEMLSSTIAHLDALLNGQ